MSCTNIFCKSLFTDGVIFTSSSEDPEYPFPTAESVESQGCCDTNGKYKTATTEGGIENEWIMMDFGIAVGDGYRFLLTETNLSSLSEICIQGSPTNNFDESDPVAFEAELSVDASGFVCFTVPKGVCYRYWRIIVKCDPMLSCLQFGLAYHGDGMQLSRGNVAFPVTINEIDRSQVLITESGRLITDVRPKAQTISFEYTGLDDKSVRELKCLWKSVCLSGCFLVELDPDLCFSCEKEDMTFLVRFNSPPSCTMSSFKKYSMTFDLIGIKEWRHGACI